MVHFLDLMHLLGSLFFILFHYLLLFIRYGLPYFLIIFCINVFFGKLYIYKKTYKKTHYRFLEQKQLYYSLFLIKKYNYSIFLLLNLISYLILFYFDLLQSISILIVFFLFFIFLIINVFLKNNYLRSLGTSSRATFTLFINLIVICVCAFYINVVGLIINQVIELHLNLSNYLYDVSYIKNNFLK